MGIRYEIPKVVMLYGWVGLLAMVTIRRWSVIRMRSYDPRLSGWLWGWVAVAVVTAVLGVDPFHSLIGNYYRRDGLVTLMVLVILSLWLWLFWDKSWRRWLTGGLVVGSSMVSLWAVGCGFRYFILGDLSASEWGGPIGVTFGNPNFLAGYLVVSLPMTIHRWEKADNRRRKWLAGWLLVSQYLAIGVTRSWIGLVLAMGIWMIRWLMGKRINLWGWLVVGAGTAALLAGVYWTQVKSSDFIAESRERIYFKTFLGWTKRPWLGYGWANAGRAFAVVDWPYRIPNDVPVDKAHMQILEVLATTGVVGLVVYFGLIWRLAVLIQGLVAKDQTGWWRNVALMGVMYLIHVQTNVISINEEVLFWLVLGIVGAETARGVRAGKSRHF